MTAVESGTDTETPTKRTPLWTSEGGCIYRDGQNRGMLYVSGDSLQPDPHLADIVAMRMNSYEQANPGALDERDKGYLELHPARDRKG